MANRLRDPASSQSQLRDVRRAVTVSAAFAVHAAGFLSPLVPSLGDRGAGVSRKIATSIATAAGSSILSGNPCSTRERRASSALTDGFPLLVAHGGLLCRAAREGRDATIGGTITHEGLPRRVSNRGGSVITSGDEAGVGLVQVHGRMVPLYVQTRVRACTCTLHSRLRTVITRCARSRAPSGRRSLRLRAGAAGRRPTVGSCR